MHRALESINGRLMNYLGRGLCHRLPGSALGYLEQDVHLSCLLPLEFKKVLAKYHLHSLPEIMDLFGETQVLLCHKEDLVPETACPEGLS